VASIIKLLNAHDKLQSPWVDTRAWDNDALRDANDDALGKRRLEGTKDLSEQRPSQLAAAFISGRLAAVARPEKAPLTTAAAALVQRRAIQRPTWEARPKAQQ
jgi:hypothetical protein